MDFSRSAIRTLRAVRREGVAEMSVRAMLVFGSECTVLVSRQLLNSGQARFTRDVSGFQSQTDVIRGEASGKSDFDLRE